MALLPIAALTPHKTIKREMKQLLGLIAMVLVMAACNNGGEGEGVGDSLSVDPTTAQPITTEPDTLDINKDSLSINQNHP